MAPPPVVIAGGNYELLEIAGEGGMATVYRGVMRGAAGFSRAIAVKKIKPEFRAIRNYIDMFVEEARVGSDLAHPNIVQVHDFCIDAQGSYYLVMEWIEGIDLGAFVRSYRDVGMVTPWPLVAAIGIGTLRGLAAAHERRHPDGNLAPVVHRDVSPHNILLGVNGVVKLSDFGLARARDRMMSLTAPGTVKGKLSYLSPEVALGQSATPLSDVFAVGSVLWEALAAQRLFDGRSDLDVFKLIRNCEVRPLAAARPDLPPALVRVIERALQKDPADRHGSAREMALALAEVLKSMIASTDAQLELGNHVIEARRRVAPGPASPMPPRAGLPPPVPAPRPIPTVPLVARSDEPSAWTYDVLPGPPSPEASPGVVQRQSVEVAYGSVRPAGRTDTSPSLPGLTPAGDRDSVEIEFSDPSLDAARASEPEP